MTYRERRLARADRLREWADKRRDKAASSFTAARKAVDGIPFGQPILVGHHSERHHRRAIEKSDNAMRRGVESQELASSMSSRAANIEAAVESSIYRDDPNAIELLTEKIAALEARRARMKAENAAYRKGDEAYAACLGITVEAAAAMRARIDSGHSWLRQPHPSYSLQNLGGTISREKKRLEDYRKDRELPAERPRGEGETATARAGLVVSEGMTTPSRPGKQPRPVWTVGGKCQTWRALLVELGGRPWAGSFSFWQDPTADLEAALLRDETSAPPGFIKDSAGFDAP